MTAKGPRKKLEQQAFEAGEKARAAGKMEEDCPPYPAVSLQESWLLGYRKIAAPTQVPTTAPTIKTAENPAHFWPKGKPLPEEYERAYHPCKFCKRTQLPDGQQAVVVANTGHGKVYLQCRALDCRQRWSLPIKASR